MAFETITGIVLRHADYRDNDRILTLLTKERGLISVTARGVLKKSSLASSVVRDVCAYGEFVIYERSGILCVSSSAIIEAFYPLREDYDKLVSASQIAHIAERLAAELAPEELFSLVYHSLSFIAYGQNVPAAEQPKPESAAQQPKDIELCFLAKLMSLAGYEPVMTRCVGCGVPLVSQKMLRFSYSQGGALCDNCGENAEKVSALAMEALRRMIRLPLRDMGKVRLPDGARRELDRLLYGYAEYVLEQPLRLRLGKGKK